MRPTCSNCALIEEERGKVIDGLRAQRDELANLLGRAVNMFFFACPEVRVVDPATLDQNNPMLQWYAATKPVLDDLGIPTGFSGLVVRDDEARLHALNEAGAVGEFDER